MSTSSTSSRAAAGSPATSGSTAGHREVSEACAEDVLLPAVRAADPGTVVLADGFSCRTQIHELDTGREGVHLAELLAAGMAADPADRVDGSTLGPVRPSPPSVAARAAALTATGALALAAARRLTRAARGAA